MLHGTFIEQPIDEHVEIRHRLLGSGAVLPPPCLHVAEVQADTLLNTFEDTFLNDLHSTGLLVFQLDKLLTNNQFIALGSFLGTAMPETDPTVKPYVEQNVILNLVSAHGHTADVSLQPFATNFLTLHTESSGRRVEEQPRYIILMCDDPGDDATSAQTVLIPMAAVERRLSAQHLRVLSQTRYRNSHHGPMLVRDGRGRRIFSFRDFFRQALDWTYLGDDTGADDVNPSINALLTSMYMPDTAAGVHWTSGMLVLMDNTFFFHGRTAGAVATSSRPRHLKRLRII